MSGNVVVLAGGTGGAKFVRGVAGCVPPERLTVIVNTGDDVTMHGLRISPDVDIITYTLAGLVDPLKAWGFAQDSFVCLEQLRGYGRPGWFNLGDRDLATHLHRTNLLAQGKTPSAVADDIRRALGVQQRILLMTDQTVETHVQLADGSLVHFQEYLIERGAPDDVQAIIFQNIGAAQPAAGVLQAIAEADVLLIAPSSPVVSIGTILSVNGIFDAIVASKARGVAVSPLLGGAPVSGPSAQLMRAFGIAVSNEGLADAYAGLIDLLVIHDRDAADAPALEQRGLTVLAIDTLMPDLPASLTVARSVLAAVDYPVTQVPPPQPPPFQPLTPGPDPHTITAAAPDPTGAEVEALRTRIAELDAQLLATEDAAVAWAELDALQRTVEELREEVEETRDKLARATADADLAWSEHDAAQLALDEQRRAARDEQTAADVAEAREAAAVTQAAALEAQLAAAEAERAEQQVNLDRQRASAAEDARVRDAEAQRALDTVVAHGERLRGRIAALEAERNALRDGGGAGGTSDTQEVQAQFAALTEELRATRAAGERAQVANAQWEEAFRGIELQGQERVAALERETTVLAETRAEAQVRSATLTEQLADREHRLGTAEAEHREQVRVLEQEAWRLMAARDEARQEGDMAEQRADAEDTAGNMAESRTHARIQELETALREAAQQRRQSRERRTVQRERARQVIGHLRARLATAEAVAAESRGNQSARVREDLRSAVAGLQAQVQKLQAQLDAATTAIAASEAHVAKLQRKIPEETATPHPPAPPAAPSTTPPAPAADTPKPAQSTAGKMSNVPASLETLGWTPSDEAETMAERARRRGGQRR